MLGRTMSAQDTRRNSKRIEPAQGEDVLRTLRRVVAGYVRVPEEVTLHAGHHQRRIVMGCRSCGGAQDAVSTTPLGVLLRSSDHAWAELRTEVKRFSDAHRGCPTGTRFFWAPGNRGRSYTRYEVGA